MITCSVCSSLTRVKSPAPMPVVSSPMPLQHATKCVAASELAKAEAVALVLRASTSSGTAPAWHLLSRRHMKAPSDTSAHRPSVVTGA